MKVHQVLDGEVEETVCCGRFIHRLPSGDLITEHAGIITCGYHVLRCPDCNRQADYIGLATMEPGEVSSMCESRMKVDPCAHEFRVRVGLDLKIRLEKIS